MKNITTFLFFLFVVNCFSQHWITEKYSYDSTLNVVYGTAVNFIGGIDTLRMDIYTPRCDGVLQSTNRPLLIWIHGGAFLAGDKNEVSVTNLCKKYARRGYVTASINYRLGFISDDQAWNCVYPNYSCVFASDSAEWHRALYRGIQDGKGAVRYLVNRYQVFRIDTNNVFVAGESAGSFIALGIGLLDTIVERMPQTYSIPDAPKPEVNSQNCLYSINKKFLTPTIKRPDLGSIDGDIEPTTINYTIKGIGSNYGAMTSDLLKYSSKNKPKPAIYSFHQPCDLVVPIDSGGVYTGLSWCMANGYNCFGIINTAKLYGSRTIGAWNIEFKYGYNIHNEFTSTSFPYNFLFGPGSCADQINNPCHAYDNSTLRDLNLAKYFAPLISTFPVCDTGSISNAYSEELLFSTLFTYPNPFQNSFKVVQKSKIKVQISVANIYGVEILGPLELNTERNEYDLSSLPLGIYFLKCRNEFGQMLTKKLIKN